MSRYALRVGDMHVAISGDTVIGRAPECDVVLEGGAVSRRHARLRVAGRTVTLADLGSMNGVLLNGRPVREPVEVKHGDRIRVGDHELTFMNVDRHAMRTLATPLATTPRPLPTPAATATTRGGAWLAHVVLDGAVRALADRDLEEAQAAMEQATDQILRALRAGARPDDSLLDRAAELLLGVAAATLDRRWLDAVLELMSESAHVPEEPVLQALVGTSRGVFPGTSGLLREFATRIGKTPLATADRERLQVFVRLLAAE